MNSTDWVFETTEIYSVTVCEAGGLRAVVPLQAGGKIPSLCRLLATLGVLNLWLYCSTLLPCHVMSPLLYFIPFQCVHAQLSLFCRDTSHWVRVYYNSA